jgi:hypothetical protein
MRRRPRPGDRVRVPFGLDICEGRVVYVAPTPKRPRVTVAVEVTNPDEPVLMTYQVSDLEEIPPAA